MSESRWSPWRIAALALVLVAATALVTGVGATIPITAATRNGNFE